MRGSRTRADRQPACDGTSQPLLLSRLPSSRASISIRQNRISSVTLLRRLGDWILDLNPPAAAPTTCLDLESRVLFAP
ncbi:hypothetical protein ACSDR0_27120 [Streptosporangium sp. G11]|uniref:hypothetical protein n=1 Tax=Streptosporangium sp. G11 TaxID=3436926 RepID=UPI003EBBC418